MNMFFLLLGDAVVLFLERGSFFFYLLSICEGSSLSCARLSISSLCLPVSLSASLCVSLVFLHAVISALTKVLRDGSAGFWTLGGLGVKAVAADESHVLREGSDGKVSV